MTTQNITRQAFQQHPLPARHHLILRIFIIAEILDIISTFAGIWLFPGMVETNPFLAGLGGWIPLILLKFAVTLVVFFILARIKNWPRLVWLIPAIAVLPVIWNAFNILAETLL